jgi:hypothetical protein
MNIEDYINKYAASYKRGYEKNTAGERLQDGAKALGLPAALLTTVLASARRPNLKTVGKSALISGIAGTAAGAMVVPKRRKVFKKIDKPEDIVSNIQTLKKIGSYSGSPISPAQGVATGIGAGLGFAVGSTGVLSAKKSRSDRLLNRFRTGMGLPAIKPKLGPLNIKRGVKAAGLAGLVGLGIGTASEAIGKMSR